ncbi:MAG TPA: GNAT family N-acetyltransferase [Xanthomonadaceae bacterium]|nr:GNAT family N-acetyltransferase [Xanthomonadaceae bacterium]
MAARNRLPPWHEELRLRDGRELLIRPVRPDDAGPLREGFALLQPDEVRHRFLRQQADLSAQQADRLCRPDPRNEFALVAAEPLPPGEALVGAVARAARIENSKDAEFSILVSHFIAGQGLGRHLMRRIVRWARGKKFERLRGDVLADNAPMLALADSLGFKRTDGAGDPNLVRVVLDL